MVYSTAPGSYYSHRLLDCKIGVERWSMLYFINSELAVQTSRNVQDVQQIEAKDMSSNLAVNVFDFSRKGHIKTILKVDKNCEDFTEWVRGY